MTSYPAVSSDARIALVTGCSAGGMGAAFCRGLRRAGYRVFATARKLSAMEELRATGCDLVELDVCDAESIKRAYDNISQQTDGRLHLLVNNAGRGLAGPILTSSMEDIRNLFDTNVVGLIACTHAFAPLLIRTAAQEKGTSVGTFRPKIVNVGSIAGIRATPWSGIYSSSKHAVHGLSDALRLELRGFGVDVLVIAPGVIRTSFSQNVAAYAENLVSANKELESEIYSNIADINEARKRAIYGGAGSETEQWAAEQVGIMTRAEAPAYYVSGGQSWKALIIPYLPIWLVDRLLGTKFGCDLVAYKPKAM